MKMLTDWKD